MPKIKVTIQPIDAKKKPGFALYINTDQRFLHSLHGCLSSFLLLKLKSNYDNYSTISGEGNSREWLSTSFGKVCLQKWKKRLARSGCAWWHSCSHSQKAIQPQPKPWGQKTKGYPALKSFQCQKSKGYPAHYWTIKRLSRLAYTSQNQKAIQPQTFKETRNKRPACLTILKTPLVLS